MRFFPPVRIPLSERRVFTYTGADETFVVPGYVTSVRIKCWGAGGGGGFAVGWGGGGGFVQADLAVTPGESLTVRVGRGGRHANTTETEYPDGQPANWLGAGGGGGSSSVSKSGVVIGAGGGGGAGDGNSGSGAIPGEPGGVNTAATPSGGAGGHRFASEGTAIGGNSATTGGTNPSVVPGTGATPGNTGDADYGSSAGMGGSDGANGQPGRVVILW